MGGDTLVLQAVLLVARKLVLHEAGIIHGTSGRDVEAWAKRKARLLARSLTPEEKAAVGADPGSWPERITMPMVAWSTRHKAPRRCFPTSKKIVWRNDPKLQKASYRTFCRWMQGGRSLFSPTKKRTDLCDYRMQFDHDEKVISEILNECRRRAPLGFFDAFDVEFKFPDDAAGEYRPTASPKFLQSFARFMNHSAEAVHEPLRATLRVASEKLLEKGGWHDVVQGYSAHWALRDHQQAAFDNMMECLPVNAMCVHWDFQEAWMDVSKFPDDGRW